MAFPDGTTVEGSALARGEKVVAHIDPGPRRVEIASSTGRRRTTLEHRRPLHEARAPRTPGAALTEPSR